MEFLIMVPILNCVYVIFGEDSLLIMKENFNVLPSNYTGRYWVYSVIVNL